MSWYHNYRELSEIPEIQFEGYLWSSEKSQPVIISPEDSVQDILQDFTLDKPVVDQFIVEALLYSQDKNISISIRHTHGSYSIAEIALDHSAIIQTTESHYLGNRLHNRHLMMKDIWVEQPDPECEGFKVLQHAGRAFAGFINKG